MPKRKYAVSNSSSNKRYKPSRKYYKAKRKAKAKARVTTVVRAPGPLAPRTICKMKYVQEIKTDGVNHDYIFNLNSTYDPDRTGSGHQPYGRDTYAALYNSYRVFAVQYKIYFSSNTVTSCRGALMWNTATSAINNYGLINEFPKSRTCIYGVNAPRTLSGHLTLANIVGVTKTQYKTDDRYAAVVGANPAQYLCLHIFNSDNDGDALASDVGQIRVELKYFVEWFDPVDMSQS